jgi:hypothetical protein
MDRGLGFSQPAEAFVTFSSWADAYAHTQQIEDKTVWAIVQFNRLPLYFFLTSRALEGQVARSVHAEENVIQNFKELLGGSLARELVRTCNIYLSESPCTVMDPRASNSLEGYPASCTAKLKVLAHSYPNLQINVYFAGTYGALDVVTGQKHMGEVFLRMLVRLTHVFAPDGPRNKQEISLVHGLLEDFFPAQNIAPDDTMAVIVALRREAQTKGMEVLTRIRDVGELLPSELKQLNQVAASTIIKALQGRSGKLAMVRKDQEPKVPVTNTSSSSFSSSSSSSSSLSSPSSSSSSSSSPHIGATMRNDLASSIFSRATGSPGDPDNLTIQPRSFDSDPPNP